MPDPRDLRFSRRLAASPAQIWRCWTEPALLERWFAPKPVVTRDVVIEPVPGGRFFTRMILPDGTEMAGDGCILLAEPERRLIWTDCLGPGFRPADEPFLTAEITLVPDGTGTQYGARVLHRSAENSRKHAEMGFHDGWGAAVDQLAVLAQGLD